MTEDQGRYNIVRFYKEGGWRIIQRNVPLWEAQAHCRDPQTSSRTATGKSARALTRRRGDWFDGYENA
jgi:hypothetical protein